jgi:hypothetical protein
VSGRAGDLAAEARRRLTATLAFVDWSRPVSPPPARSGAVGRSCGLDRLAPAARADRLRVRARRPARTPPAGVLGRAGWPVRFGWRSRRGTPARRHRSSISAPVAVAVRHSRLGLCGSPGRQHGQDRPDRRPCLTLCALGERSLVRRAEGLAGAGHRMANRVGRGSVLRARAGARHHSAPSPTPPAGPFARAPQAAPRGELNHDEPRPEALPRAPPGARGAH